MYHVHFVSARCYFLGEQLISSTYMSHGLKKIIIRICYSMILSFFEMLLYVCLWGKRRIMSEIWLCWWGLSCALPVWLWSGRAAEAVWAGPWGCVLSQAAAQPDPELQPPTQLSECATGPAHPIFAAHTCKHTSEIRYCIF